MRSPRIFLFIFGLLFSGSWASYATTVSVRYGSFFFDPAVVTINVGDTVSWNSGLGSHTVEGTGTDPICGGAFLPCSHTFNTPGTFPYECTVLGHAAAGMTGTVIVAGSPGPAPAQLTNGVHLSNGQFRFTVVSTANHTNIIQASTNLAWSSNWVPLMTMVPTTNIFTFTDTNAIGMRLRFYRVVQPP